MNKIYIYPENCREISGIGGEYEKTCKLIVTSFLDFLEYKTNDNIICYYKEFISKNFDDISGAMYYTCFGHIEYILKYGWINYLKTIKKDFNKYENK